MLNSLYLTGRIGAAHPGQGKDIHFVRQGNAVQGRVGGEYDGFDIRGDLSPSAIHLRLGGQTVGEDLHLDIRSGQVSGRYGGKTIGKDVHLTQQGAAVTGRIGAAHPRDGKDAQLSANDVPLEVATLLILCAFKALEDMQQQIAASS